MNSRFKFNVLSFFCAKRVNNGFTLIELLVVVIIIGILAAVALPNLLRQIGKARETEAKNAMGTLNRAQQAYHLEKGVFAPEYTNNQLKVNNALGVIIPASSYYRYYIAGDATTAVASADGWSSGATPTQDDGISQGTRNYSARIIYSLGTYSSAICQAKVSGTTTGFPDPTTLACDNFGSAVK